MKRSVGKKQLLAAIILNLAFAVSAVSPAAGAEKVRIAITDDSGRPVASAAVVVSGETTVRAISDGNGIATIGPVETPATVTVSAPSFKVEHRAIAAGTTSVSITLTPSAGALHIIGSVTGHGRTPFNATPVAQKVFPREAYRDQGQPSARTVIDQTPGVLAAPAASGGAGSPYAPSSVIVRGSLPYETPVSLDGEPVWFGSTGTFDLNLVPTFDLQEVEIVKGPGDVAGLGSGVGGAVNFRTSEPTAVRRAFPETEVDSHGGSFSDISYVGTVPGGKLAFSSMAEVDGTPCCGPLPADAVRKSLLLKLRYMPSQALTVTGTFLGTNLDRSLGASNSAESAGTFFSLLPSTNVRENERFRFEDVVTSLDRGDDAYAFHLYDSATTRERYDGLNTNATDRASGASLEWQHAAGKNSYGLLARSTYFTSDNNDPYEQPLAGGSSETLTYLRGSATLRPSSRDEVDLSGGGIFTGMRTAAFATVNEQRTGTAPEGRIAFSHLMRPGVSLRGSYGVDAIAPPLDALSGSDPATRTPLNLPSTEVPFRSSVDRFETAGGGDVGVEWRLHGGSTTFSADWYSSVTHDAYMLERSQVAGPLESDTWFNGPPVEESGIELALQQFKPVGMGYIAQIAFPRTTVRGNLDPSFYSNGNLAIVPGPNIGGGAWFTPGENDIAAERVPYAQGYTEISYKWPRGSRASLGMLYVGSNNPYGQRAFATFNSNLELSVASRSKFQISVENLFNNLDIPVPLFGGGIGVPLVTGTLAMQNAQGLAPRTIRFMYRQSFGEGSIYEH